MVRTEEAGEGQTTTAIANCTRPRRTLRSGQAKQGKPSPAWPEEVELVIRREQHRQLARSPRTGQNSKRKRPRAREGSTKLVALRPAHCGQPRRTKSRCIVSLSAKSQIVTRILKHTTDSAEHHLHGEFARQLEQHHGLFKCPGALVDVYP